MHILICLFAKFKKASIPLESRRLEITWLSLWNYLRRATHFSDGVVASLNIETVQILQPEENKNIFMCFQLIWPRNKSND